MPLNIHGVMEDSDDFDLFFVANPEEHDMAGSMPTCGGMQRVDTARDVWAGPGARCRWAIGEGGEGGPQDDQVAACLLFAEAFDRPDHDVFEISLRCSR